jgi:acid stress-induced BolA-like protein IbaG/YrbA
MAFGKEEIENLLAQEFSDASITATGESGSYQVRVISDVFEGLNAVKRQQAVYRVLNPHIASGEIHAINMQLLTDGEQASAIN